MLTKNLCFVRNISFNIIIYLFVGKLSSVKSVFLSKLEETGEESVVIYTGCYRKEDHVLVNLLKSSAEQMDGKFVQYDELLEENRVAKSKLELNLCQDL